MPEGLRYVNHRLKEKEHCIRYTDGGTDALRSWPECYPVFRPAEAS